MNDIQLVVTDLDGTLLHDDKTVSKYTCEVISKLQMKGIRFAFATARPMWWNIHDILADIHCNAGIYNNGAVVKVEEDIIAQYIVKEPLKLIQTILANRPDTEIWAEMNGQCYANFCAERIWPGIHYNRTDYRDVPPCDFSYKVVLGCDQEAKMKEYERFLPPELYMQMSENVIAMIMHKNSNKFSAVSTLCKYWKLSPSQVVAFGDDLNDISMISGCGIGIAVSNALVPVKEAANLCCDSNEEDGPAHWMEKNLL